MGSAMQNLDRDSILLLYIAGELSADDQADLESLLDQCGFEVLRHKHFSLRDNPAGLATTLAPKLDPMSRRLRRVAESGGVRLFKNLMYMVLTIGSLPFTMLEAACRAGSTTSRCTPRASSGTTRGAAA